MTRHINTRPLAIGLTVVAALARLAPHPWNFTPVGGLSLFAGARLRGWLAFVLPLVLMAATDPLLGGYSRATPLVYLAFLINVWIGRHLQRSESVARIGGAALLCSLQFFLLTNIPSWLAHFPHTWAGFAECYALALPFFGWTLAGDLVYTAALFGLHGWLSRTVGKSERVSLEAA
jgi:hypothetical protein